MKNLLRVTVLAICAIFMVANVSAQVITAERASEIANKFFANGKQKSAAFRSTNATLTQSIDSRAVTGESNDAPTFHILTGADGKGFVIVSGEETENPIIGYSFDGTIDTNNLPDGFVDYMTDIDAQVRALREYNAANPQKAVARSAMQKAANFEYNATTMGNIVKNLNTAPWGQGEPFNNLCYVGATGTTSKAKTGCGPTAFAILCYYYKWPASGVGTVTHQGTGENMVLGHAYDYENMRNDKYPTGYTEEQANAVAVLMRDLGWANQVGYGTSSTSYSETAQHMVDHFRFKSVRPVDHGASLAVVRSTLGNDTQWKTYIKNSLDAGYPIPYASTTDASNSGRHIYILDGYTDNDYYHFNWGWSGKGNGWFTLDNMVPDDYSNYSNSHKAYYIIPDATTYTVTARVNDSNMGTVSINGGTVGSTATADLLQGVTATLTANPVAGYALVSWTKGGVIVGTRNTLQVPVGTSGNDYVANFADESTVTVIQDYTINATSGTELTGDKVQEWAFNRNNDYPAELKLTSTAASINRNGNNIQLFLNSPKTSETYTLSVQEGYEITQYTIRCKATSSYNIKVAAEGQEITPTTSYADYKFVRSNTLARTTSNSASFTVTGNTGRYMQVESITVTVAKEGANVPSTPTTYTINVNAETGGNAYVNGTNTRVTVNAGTDVTLQAYPDGTNYTFAGWYNGNSFVSSNNPYTFALNSDVTYTAKFNAVATTCTVTTTANPAEGGTAKFAVGTGSQKTQGDVSNSEVITLYASANTGYTFVNWTLNGNVVGTAATCNVTVSQTANYVANFEAVQQGGSSSTNLAGKYFRLKVKNTTNYMNIANNTEHPGGTTGGVNVTAKNESNDGQIFQFIESGTNYKLLSKTGYYIKCQPWNVDAISVGTVLSFETAGADNEYFIKWDNTNMDNGKERDDYFKVENGYVYCDAASSAAATWVLEEVVYYTVTATAGEGGSVSPLTSTIEKGKPVTLTATANEGFRFVNWTLNGNVVSTDESYTFDATAAGEYVANFEISTYTISATANPGTAGSVTINGEAVSSKNVKENSTVTLVATPSAGYCFVNWTNGTDVVSTDATYTFTATADTNLEANFKQIVANVTLTDIQGNTYNVTLNGLTGEVNTETLAAKLKTEYPFIEEFGINPTFADNGTSYTYTNTVKLKFKVSNPASEETDNLWHNIYYPTNINGRPNYLSASTAETTLVEKVNDGTYNYGANPTYNTMGGNPKIAWAIYNVNNSFKFIFKNELTGKYIKVASIASSDAQNVEFVEKAEATAFTFLGNAGTYNGDYALVAKIDEETGYLCSSSSSYGYATHHISNTHQGAWMKIKEADYTDFIRALDERLLRFDIGNDKYLITDEFQIMIDSLVYNKEQIRLNQFNTYFDAIDKAVKTWPKISLTITPENKGTTNIGGEENVVRKYVPTGDLTIKAVPVEGYHFVKWIDGTNEVKTAAYTKNISGGKDDVIALTAEFAINIYDISVTAGEGGSASASAATAEHGSEVTLTAKANNDGYEFAGWYNGEELVSNEANYTFTATSDINYTARFNKTVVNPTKFAIHIKVASTDGTEVTNTLEGNVKAIIDGIGMEWATDAEFAADANVALSATSDHNQKGYLFDGWYKNGELVNKEKDIVVKATETATYEARFFRGCIVIGYSNNTQFGRVMGITLADGTSIGYDASSRAVVKAGTTVKINTMNIKDGYEVGSWINVNDEIVGTDNSLIVEVNEDVTYTAIFEPVSYELTVRANDDSYGTVTAESGTSSGTTIKVGHKMEATITATANTGYYFVNWTKGTEVVSTSTTYTIEGISEYDDMVDVEYIANFLPVENATAGVYYRIAYDFPVAAAAGAARAGATRAVGDVQTLTISFANGSFKTGEETGPTSIWTSSSNSPTVTLTATYEGSEYKNINKVSTTTSPLELSLNSRPFGKGSNYNETKYTIAIDDTNYKITDYSISYKSYQNGAITGAVSNQLVCTGLSNNSVSFYVTGTGQNSAVDIQNFTVTIQQVGGEGSGETPETPSNRYYIQSEACGVSGGNNLPNALKMTKETDASSIFYYADSKLLSYDKGTYIKEDGGTRGLQEVGTSGNVTITTTGETSTIAAPNYMHANSNGTTYYVDHCGSNPDNHATSHNFVLEEVTTLPVTISSALHATFYAPVAVEIPEGVTAYVLKAENIPGIETYAWMTSLKNGVIPANTGVIIKGAQGTHYFNITENTDAARAEAVGNVLSGTVAKTKITQDAYILANREGKIGLYPVAKNSYLDDNTNATTVRFTNNSHKAYLPVTDDWFGEQLKKGTGFRFVYDDEETTGIDEFETEESATIYDLQGRKLSEITEPGIYIVGGKKVWIK